MKAKAAAGADKVAPTFIKELGPRARAALLECFNLSWRTGYTPQSWRNAIIIRLLKGGKPASKMDSYRPVSLTSCFAKTMERIVGNSLYYMAEQRGWVVVKIRLVSGSEEDVKIK